MARAKGFEEYTQTFADVRGEVEANIAEAKAASDLLRYVEFKRFLLKFEKEQQKMEGRKQRNREEQPQKMEEPPSAD